MRQLRWRAWAQALGLFLVVGVPAAAASGPGRWWLLATVAAVLAVMAVGWWRAVDDAAGLGGIREKQP